MTNKSSFISLFLLTSQLRFALGTTLLTDRLIAYRAYLFFNCPHNWNETETKQFPIVRTVVVHLSPIEFSPPLGKGGRCGGALFFYWGIHNIKLWLCKHDMYSMGCYHIILERDVTNTQKLSFSSQTDDRHFITRLDDVSLV